MNFLLVSSEADKKYLSGLADFGTVVPLPPLTKWRERICP